MRREQALDRLGVLLVKVADRQVRALGPAEQRAPLLDGLADDGRVDDWQQIGEVVEQEPVEEDLVLSRRGRMGVSLGRAPGAEREGGTDLLAERDEERVLAEVVRLGVELALGALDLEIERVDGRGQAEGGTGDRLDVSGRAGAAARQPGATAVSAGLVWKERDVLGDELKLLSLLAREGGTLRAMGAASSATRVLPAGGRRTQRRMKVPEAAAPC